MSRKFDPTKWKQLDVSKSHEITRGVLQIMCSSQAALIISHVSTETGEVSEVVASVGTSHHIECAGPFEFRLLPDGKPREFLASVYMPDRNTLRPMGEVFTNIDRKPHESGTVLEVRKAVREERLRMKADIAEMREATREMKRAQSARMARQRQEREQEQEELRKAEASEAPSANNEEAGE